MATPYTRQQTRPFVQVFGITHKEAIKLLVRVVQYRQDNSCASTYNGLDDCLELMENMTGSRNLWNNRDDTRIAPAHINHYDDALIVPTP